MLELIGLRKRFGEVTALDDCSFRAEPGRILGFLGRNGAGKTTAMRSIFGLVYPDEGRVLWDGRPVTRHDRFAFGYMPEERGLYPRMRVKDQLRYFGSLRRMRYADADAEADRWLERLDLADRHDATLDSLSHGNQQRVQLAVSLIGSPSLLVLDEPFSGLDPIASETLSSVIREEAQRGTAIVFSSHQLDLVGDVCDDVAIITRGKVVLTGDLDQIRRSSSTRHVDVSFEQPVDRRQLGESALPGLDVDSWEGRRVRLLVPRETDPADVLSVVSTWGQVVDFRYQSPDLEDIFREVAG